MNQAPTSLKVLGDPHPGWRSFQTPQTTNPIHTPQDPTEDASKNWNYQKIKWYLKNFFFFFLFYKWLPETCWSFKGVRGNQLSLWNVHQVPLGIEAEPDPV